ncbi:hypothetical protein AAFN60_01085 [Roseibacillus persicicus]|nr:hypothetical protein [Roseibacillus persicicus]
MMKKTLLTLAALTASNFASPIDFDQIPAAAQWYLHADVDAVRTTEIGEELKALVEQEAGKELKAMTRIFAFDPMEDLAAVTLFGEGDNAVVLIHGEFDRAHLVDVIGGADEHEVSDYQGFQVHSWDDKGKTQHGVFVKADLLAISEKTKHLKHALDVFAGVKEPMGKGDAEGAPLMFGLANLSKMEIEDEDMEIFKEAKSVTMRMDEAEEAMIATLKISTDDAKLAKRMSRMVDGLLAMVEGSIPAIDDYGLESEVAQGDDKTKVVATVKMPSKHLVGLLEYLQTLKE